MKTKLLVGLTLIFTAFVANVSFSQNAMTSEKVSQSIKLNDKNLFDGKFYMVKVNVTDENFYGENPSQASYSKENRLQGKRIVVIRNNFRFYDEKESNAVEMIEVEKVRNLSKRFILWRDGESGYENLWTERSEGRDTNGEIIVGAGGIPLLAKQKSTYTTVLSEIIPSKNSPIITDEYIVKDNVMYKGLKCLELSFSDLNNGFSRRVFICPSIGYRTVYMTSTMNMNEGANRVEITKVFAVEKIENSNDIWVPIQIRQETVKKVNGEFIARSISKTKLFDLQVNSLSAETVFDPLIIPGTQVIDSTIDPPVPTVAGGDASDLISGLRTGDFSILEEEKDDLLPVKN